MTEVEHLIVGAGPAGLGCALALDGADALLVDANDGPGGLCRSVMRDDFVFDRGVHVLWSPHPEVEALYRDVLPDAIEHARRTRVHLGGGTCRYPIQSHLDELPPGLAASLREGLETAPGGTAPDFVAYCRRRFGDALTDRFFVPYNRKVWACDPAELSSDWASGRVPPAGSAGAWATFLYPARGGIGAFYGRLHARVACPTAFGRRLARIDPARRLASFRDGETVRYGRLYPSLPLPSLVAMCEGVPPEVADAAEGLRAADVAVVCLGVDRAGLGDGSHWDYAPDPAIPFQRVVYQSTIAPDNAPAGCSAILCEASHSPSRPIPPRAGLIAGCVAGLETLGILGRGDRVTHASLLGCRGGYIPHTPDRPGRLATILGWLHARAIRPIGRNGRWEYLNMDAAILSGRREALAA